MTGRLVYVSQFIHSNVCTRTYCMPILQEQKSAMYKDVRNADCVVTGQIPD